METLSDSRVTSTQRQILRRLYNAETGQACTSHLRYGLYGAAATLIERGWIWREDGWIWIQGERARRYCPTYGLNPEGIPAAQAAWKDT
jgi:hypothetical protein